MSRKARIPWAGAVTIMFLGGCLRVDPRSDYEATRQLLSERTAATGIYEPDADTAIDERITRLIDGGLTVDEAVQVALLNNRGFQALFARIGASRADVVQSQLLTNPSVGFAARFPSGGGRSNLTFTFGQELVDLWQIPVKRKIAEAQLEEMVSEVVRQGIELTADVQRKWYELAALRRAAEIARENLSLVKASISIAESRLKAGEVGQIDVNLLRATELDVQTTSLGILRDEEVAKANLGRALGLSRWPTTWTIAESSETPSSDVPAVQALVLFAMEQRLEARAAAARVRAHEQELQKQVLSVFPSITMGLDGERLETRGIPGRSILADTARASVRNGQLTAPDIQTRGERNIESRQIIDLILGPSIQATLPIWDQNQAQIAKASYRVTESRKEYEDLLDRVAAEVEGASAMVRLSAQLSEFFESKGLPTAQQNLELARKSYQGGELGILQVIEAQRFLITQRLAAINVQRDYLVAMVELKRSLGGRLPAAATSRPAQTESNK